MARQGIFTGFTPNDGLGDSLATGAAKVNANFQELYNILGDGNTLDPNVGSGGTWAKGNGEIGIYTSKYVGINTLIPSTHLHVEGNAYIAGVATGKFVGDGSGLTGITAVGSGVVIKNNGTLIGVAQTINFGDYIAVGTVFGGNVTINGIGTVAYANVAGVATYAVLAGVASLSNYTPLSGVATYAPVAGVATFATTAGVVTYAQSAGVATAAGNAFYATVAGVATYTPTAGVSTVAGYATTAGIATVARNLTGTPSLLLDNINLTGIATIAGQGSRIRFDFDSTTDLPPATSWRGMFAYANNTKSAYVSMGTTMGGYNGWRTILAEDQYGNYYTAGVVTASKFVGDGSLLTNLPGADSYWRQTSVGIHTLANVGVGTTNPTSKVTVDGDGKFTGVVTATTFIGSVTGNVTGNATGLSGSPNITVGVITASSVNIGTSVTINNTGVRATGVVTATAFVGDGSGLTGVVATGTGIGVYDDNVLAGTASSVNFGSNLSITFGSGIATVSGASSVGNATTAYSLAGSPSINVAAITGTSLNVGSGQITGGSISGTSLNGNSLVSPNINASGIATIGTLRVGSAVTITSNGVESTIGVITALAFVGDGSGLTNLNATRLTSGTVNNSRLPSNISVAGSVTASSFFGDGSNLTGVVAAGSGIIVRDDGSLVGTAASLDFGTGLTVSPVSAGIATITATGGGVVGGGGTWTTVNAGIYTSKNVGIATTNPIYPFQVGSGSTTFIVDTLGEVGVGTTPTSKLHVIGDAMISGVVTATRFQSTVSGTPTIDSPDLLTISAPRVAISTTLTTGGNAGIGTTNPTSRLHVIGDTVTTGIVTAVQFRTNSTIGDGTDVGFAIKYYITANGASAYRFAGPGLINTTDNPTLYLQRGFTYIFENSTGGSHPFAIRYSSGGTGYGSTYLSGSQSGTQIFTVPFDAPSSLVYQCTLHGSMLGTLNIVT